MNVEIAQRLAARRKHAGLSQEALAERLGVSRQAVSKWERSESSPDTDNLIALAELYGVSLDELLYADDEMRDDAGSEAADGAAKQPSPEALGAPGASGSGSAEKAEAPDAGFASKAAASCATSAETGEPSESAKKVKIGLGGIHVMDGEDYVHLTWQDGVHVKDSKKGDEVHVGWNGVQVKEGATSASAASAAAAEAAKADEGNEGNEVVVNGDGVIINGQYYENWHEAHKSWSSADDSTESPSSFAKTWLKFPYPLIVIVVYLLLGILHGAWGMGLFLFFTIPLYYMLGHAINRKRLAPLVYGAYPVLATAWFCWMAFVNNAPHPAWVAFLTIPLVEWLTFSLSRWWRTRKTRKAAQENTPIDIDPQ